MTAITYMTKQASLAAMRRKKPTSISVPCTGLASKKGGGTWGVSCKREDKSGSFFVTTHRARSKGYASLSEIPVSKVRFVDSTG